ncbi:DUF962 domain-containing protein [Sinimarinibacterium sp. CAU 1509]|uniref:Mpo1 family 2-hydroxy fatty acid dioxygenase n=1 Tax=Sinimarinibacterium sp. CAU 1509 TaxID=2562283 RepID=UPI0010AC31AF|nr:Mpo1-like protein [Sinimarinibacterium sp. CAU 1509]TJY59393.1 DUF962 domain-containing protein [Sinimarinibacterium sp. CAU 1509]
MKTLRDWLNEYSESHRNPTNKLLHWICIPPIVFSIACALKLIPVGTDVINVTTVVGLLVLAYYFRLSWQLGIGMVLIFGVAYAGVLVLESALGAQMIFWAGGLFVLAWIGQFVGHYVEGARPSFFKDLQFLLVGPLWLLSDVYRRMAIPMGAGAVAVRQSGGATSA